MIQLQNKDEKLKNKNQIKIVLEKISLSLNPIRTNLRKVYFLRTINR